MYLYHSFFLQALTGELSSFMCSAAHVNQMDRHPSTVGAFLEGVVKCKPQPHIRSCVLKVLKNFYTLVYIVVCSHGHNLLVSFGMTIIVIFLHVFVFYMHYTMSCMYTLLCSIM